MEKAAYEYYHEQYYMRKYGGSAITLGTNWYTRTTLPGSMAGVAGPSGGREVLPPTAPPKEVLPQTMPSQDVTPHNSKCREVFPHLHHHHHPNQHVARIGGFDLEKTIGRGNYAVVKLAKHVILKNEVAVKIIDKSKLDADNLNKVQREIEVLKRLHHPYIIKLYQVFESEQYIYIATEYAQNGEVFDLITRSGRLSEHDARILFWQMLAAVEYLHENGVVHRDIKAENILLDYSGRVRLADFGFSNFYSGDQLLKTYCGSPPYASPEVFAGKAYHGPSIDVWSLGITLYVMVTGTMPFEGYHIQELREKVTCGRFRIPFFMSNDCENLIRRMLTVDESKRITLPQIKEHKWMREGGHEERVRRDIAAFDKVTSLERTSACVQVLANMGVSGEDVIKSLETNTYDHAMCMYQLLMERFKRRNFEATVFSIREEEDREKLEKEAEEAAKEPKRARSEELAPVIPEVVDEVPPLPPPEEVLSRSPRPSLRTLRGCNQFQTTDTGFSMEEGGTSTLSRQSTINTVGSIDEGVDIHNFVPSSSNPLARLCEQPPMESFSSETDGMSSTTSCQNSEDSHQGGEAEQPAMNCSTSFPTGDEGRPGSSSFGYGLRASDNTMYESVQEAFPTGKLGKKTKGVNEFNRPSTDAVHRKLEGLKLASKGHLEKRKAQALCSTSKRISLPESLEFQPQKFLNMKKSMVVEQHLEHHDTSFESKMQRARMNHLQKRQQNKNRLQLLRQQTSQLASTVRESSMVSESLPEESSKHEAMEEEMDESD